MKFLKNLLLKNKRHLTSNLLQLAFALVLSFITFELVLAANITDVSETAAMPISSDNSISVASINPQVKAVSIEITSQDRRAVVLEAYFSKFSSPLAGYGDLIVENCDKYGFPSDCTLLVAIAYTETKLCNDNITAKQFNCWGWGGSGTNRVIYSNFDEAIEKISRDMSRGYSAYLKRPDLMSRTYCGAHCGNWANAVTDQQNAIHRLAREMGIYNLGN